MIHLSGVWNELYQSYLGSKEHSKCGLRDYSERKDLKGRIIAGTGAIAPAAEQEIIAAGSGLFATTCSVF